MSIRETLIEIGLNDKEIKVYTTLLKHGRMLPSRLSTMTKINRATIYSISKSLLSKGIIAQDLGGSTLYLSPLPLDSLNQIFEKQRRELDKKEAAVKKAIADLSLISTASKYTVPKIRFVEEDNLEDFLYDNAVKWIRQLYTTDGIWWSIQDDSFVEHYESFVEWVGKLKEYKNPKIKSHLLTNMSSIEQKMESKIPRSKRDIRFVSGMDFTSSIWVSGDYIVMVVTRQHPFHLVEIHDATLAHNMREVFKKMWFFAEK